MIYLRLYPEFAKKTKQSPVKLLRQIKAIGYNGVEYVGLFEDWQ